MYDLIGYDLVGSRVEQICALKQHVGDHEEYHIEVLVFPAVLHDVQEFRLSLEELLGGVACYLAHGYVVTGDVEFLVISLEEVQRILRDIRGEERSSEIVKRDAGYLGKPLRHRDIALRACGRFEQNGVGEDRAGHETCHRG